MLQAGRALMFYHGFRPSSAYKHVSVVKFVSEILSEKTNDNMIKTFDRIRRKRHLAIYGEPETVSQSEAERAIKWAREFLDMIERQLTQK